jgi:hypothetical protein
MAERSDGKGARATEIKTDRSIADACGDVSDQAHERAMDRMIQSEAQPMTSVQYLLELQRYWARDPATGMTTSSNGHKFDHTRVVVLTYQTDHYISGLGIYWDRPTVDQRLGVKP